jgi:hypothetical protein
MPQNNKPPTPTPDPWWVKLLDRVGLGRFVPTVRGWLGKAGGR